MLLEKTQRRLCRLLFVLGCVLPTLAVAGFTSGRLRPAYAEDLLQAVGERLGASIACESLSTPRPGVYELRQVTLADVAGGREFANCDVLQLNVGVGGVRFSAKTVSVRQPADAWGLRLLESGFATRGQIATLLVDGKTRVERVNVSLEPGAASVASETGDSVTARLSEGACHVELVAEECAIPVEWLPCESLHAVAAGRRQFTGTMTSSIPLEAGPVQGELSGQLKLHSVAFEGVKAEHGSVDDLQLDWRGQRIERFAGRLELRDGQLSRPIVWGMCRWLAMEPFAALETVWAEAPNQCWFEYSQLACEVELDSNGLVVVAGCGEIDGKTRSGAVAHAVVEHKGSALLKQPTLRPLPVQRLVQALRPDDPAELPATPDAIEMASRLPGIAPK